MRLPLSPHFCTQNRQALDNFCMFTLSIIITTKITYPKPSDEQRPISRELRNVGLAVHFVDDPRPFRRDVPAANIGAIGRREPGAARAARLPRRHEPESREGPPPAGGSRTASPVAGLRPGPGEVEHLVGHGEAVQLAVRLPRRLPASTPPYSSHPPLQLMLL